MKKILFFAALFFVFGRALCQEADTTKQTSKGETYNSEKQSITTNDSVKALGAEIARLKSEILIQGKKPTQIQTSNKTNSESYNEAEYILDSTLSLLNDTNRYAPERTALGSEIEQMKYEIIVQNKKIKQIQSNLITASDYYHKSEVCLGVTIGLSILSGVLFGVNAFYRNKALQVFGSLSGLAGIGTGISSIVMWSKGNKALKSNLNSPN